MTRLPLANSEQHALVDDDAVDDLSRFRTWYLVVLRGKAYARGFDRLSKKREFLHHAAYFGRILTLYSGRDTLDHIDGDGLNCQRSNLRLATSRQNSQNRKPRSGTACGLKGVTETRSGRFKAQIEVRENGMRRTLHLGVFATPEEAAAKYEETALRLHGDWAYRPRS